jgi:hypothetical protein
MPCHAMKESYLLGQTQSGDSLHRFWGVFLHATKHASATTLAATLDSFCDCRACAKTPAEVIAALGGAEGMFHLKDTMMISTLRFIPKVGLSITKTRIACDKRDKLAMLQSPWPLLSAPPLCLVHAPLFRSLHAQFRAAFFERRLDGHLYAIQRGASIILAQLHESSQIQETSMSMAWIRQCNQQTSKKWCRLQQASMDRRQGYAGAASTLSSTRSQPGTSHYTSTHTREAHTSPRLSTCARCWLCSRTFSTPSQMRRLRTCQSGVRKTQPSALRHGSRRA